MKRSLLLIPLLACLTLLPGDRPHLPPAVMAQAPAPSADVPLEVKGDTVKVQVDRVIVVKEERLLVRSLPFTIHAAAKADLYFWSFPPSVHALDKGDKLEVISAPKGQLVIGVKVVTAVWKEQRYDTRFGSVSLDVGEVTPTPVPPGPTPPDPGPKPPPIPTGGLRVLFIRESADTGKMTTEQEHAWNSTKIVAWLNAKVEKDEGRPSWRKWDDDVDKTHEVKVLRDLWEAVKGQLPSLPALVVANGTVATVYPLTNEDDALRILAKHAEPTPKVNVRPEPRPPVEQVWWQVGPDGQERITRWEAGLLHAEGRRLR